METIGTQHDQLLAQLELYAEGDVSFKNELKELIILDLQELKSSVLFLDNSLDVATGSFDRTLHKIKVSLDILNSTQLWSLLERLAASIRCGDSLTKDRVPQLIAGYCDQTSELLKQL